MTLVRGAAVKISAFVVRWASSGCKEWAEGLAREVDFIESDWRALWWALGSARVLLDYREAPMTTLDEVPEAAEKFIKFARGRAFCMCLLSLMGPLNVLIWFPRMKSWTGQAACAAVVLGSIASGVFLWKELRRPKKPVNDETTEWSLFYKKELEHCNSTLIISVAIFLCYYVSCAFFGPNYAYGFACLMLGMLLAVLVPKFVYEQRNNRRRIERIEELMGERP
jgi:membrane protein implicated in regulation of membrane protease activity